MFCLWPPPTKYPETWSTVGASRRIGPSRASPLELETFQLSLAIISVCKIAIFKWHNSVFVEKERGIRARGGQVGKGTKVALHLELANAKSRLPAPACY